MEEHVLNMTLILKLLNNVPIKGEGVFNKIYMKYFKYV